MQFENWAAYAAQELLHFVCFYSHSGFQDMWYHIR